MRKSFAAGLGLTVVAAVVVAVFALWLPHRHAQQDQAWQQAGQRALAAVPVPAGFRPVNDAGKRIQHCVDGSTIRCFVAPQAPRLDVAALRAALGHVAVGPVSSSCVPVQLPNSPRTCVLQAPVRGSRLRAEVFARSIGPLRPLAQMHYAGAYVIVHLTDR